MSFLSLVLVISGEKTPSVPGAPPPNVAKTGASAHPEGPPGQPDALHRSQVQQGGREGGMYGGMDGWWVGGREGWMEGWMDGGRDGWMEGGREEWLDGWGRMD